MRQGIRTPGYQSAGYQETRVSGTATYPGSSTPRTGGCPASAEGCGLCRTCRLPRVSRSVSGLPSGGLRRDGAFASTAPVLQYSWRAETGKACERTVEMAVEKWASCFAQT
jgi:hypothetical protein